jgi:hypothetical protein
MDFAAPSLADPLAARLQAQHLDADRAGRARCVRRRGRAEALLWAAPERRILRRLFSDGARASEVRVLLDEQGRALAWWQRSSGGRMPLRPVLPPLAATLRHITLITIDGPWHDLGVQPVIDELAALSGRDPGRPPMAPVPATAAPCDAAASLAVVVAASTSPLSTSPGA